jgi:ribosomal-protein-alanine N-acetyltransferase
MNPIHGCRPVFLSMFSFGMPVTSDTALKHIPTFVTNRLRIRPMKLSDTKAIFAFKGDPNVTKHYGQAPKSLGETKKWVQSRLDGYKRRESMFWVFTIKPSSKAIGSCCFWNFSEDFSCAELGYELHPAYWGQGIMTEVLPPVLTYGFNQLRLHRIEACPFSNNEPSKNMLLKLGFRYEGNLRQRHRFRGRYLDQLYYAVLRDEWKPI